MSKDREKKDFAIDSLVRKPPADILDMGETKLRAAVEVSAAQNASLLMQNLATRTITPGLKLYQADFQRVTDDLLTQVKEDLKKNDLARAQVRARDASRKLESLLDNLQQNLEKAALKLIRDNRLEAKATVRIFSGFGGVEIEKPKAAAKPGGATPSKTAAGSKATDSKTARTLVPQGQRCAMFLTALAMQAEVMERDRTDLFKNLQDYFENGSRKHAVDRLKITKNAAKDALYNAIKPGCDMMSNQAGRYHNLAEVAFKSATKISAELTKLSGLVLNDKSLDQGLVDWAKKELPGLVPLKTTNFSNWLTDNRNLQKTLQETTLDRSHAGDAAFNFKAAINKAFLTPHLRNGKAVIEKIKHDAGVLKARFKA